MLKIQEFISCFDSIEEANIYLKRELQLKIEDGYLYGPRKGSEIYTYNKGRYSDMNSSLVREANGLILDEDCSIVTKGLNHHYKVKKVENLPENFKLYKCNAEEMTTGMMITIFNYGGNWHVANKDSLNDVDYSIDVKRTINSHIGDCWSSIFDEKGDSPIVFQNHIYVFDFISSTYQNVWPCSTFQLYLLAIINGETGMEFVPSVVDKIARYLSFMRPPHKELTGKRSLSSFISKAKIPTRGVILADKNIRIKIQNPLHYSIKAAIEAKDRIKPVHVAKIYQSCKDKVDLMVIATTFPQFNDFLYLFEKTVDNTWQDLATIWGAIEEFREDPKTFAKAIPKYPLNHLLFMYKDKKIKTLLSGVKSIEADRLVELAEEKYEMEFKTNERHLEKNYAYENNSLSKEIAS